MLVIGPTGIARGGAGRSAAETAGDLQRLFDWRVLYTGGAAEDWYRPATPVSLRRRTLSVRRPLDSAIALMSTRRLPFRPQIVYAHLTPDYELAWAIARVNGARLVTHLRSEVAPSRRLLRAARRADLRIAVSESTKDAWSSYLGDGARGRTCVIPNGVNVQEFRMQRVRSTTNTAPLRVLFLGRTEPDKGLDIAVGAFASAARNLPAQSTLTIAGDCRPSYRDWAKGLISRPDVPVRSVGFLGDKQAVRAELGRADVVLMPSRTEAFGRTAVEAMAAGVPVIASSVGGLKDVVAGPHANVLVTDISASGFARALVDFAAQRPVSDLDERQLVARAGRYDVAQSVEGIDRVLRELL